MQVESISIRSVSPPTSASVAGNRSTFTASGSGLPEESKTGASGGEATASSAQERSDHLDKVIGSIQEAFNESNITLKFSRDEDSGAIVIKLVDQTSGEAIQQIPSKAILHLAAALGKLQGQIFNQKA